MNMHRTLFKGILEIRDIAHYIADMLDSTSVCKLAQTCTFAKAAMSQSPLCVTKRLCLGLSDSDDNHCEHYDGCGHIDHLIQSERISSLNLVVSTPIPGMKWTKLKKLKMYDYRDTNCLSFGWLTEKDIERIEQLSVSCYKTISEDEELKPIGRFSCVTQLKMTSIPQRISDWLLGMGISHSLRKLTLSSNYRTGPCILRLDQLEELDAYLSCISIGSCFKSLKKLCLKDYASTGRQWTHDNLEKAFGECALLKHLDLDDPSGPLLEFFSSKPLILDHVSTHSCGMGAYFTTKNWSLVGHVSFDGDHARYVFAGDLSRVKSLEFTHLDGFGSQYAEYKWEPESTGRFTSLEKLNIIQILPASSKILKKLLSETTTIKEFKCLDPNGFNVISLDQSRL